MTTRPELLPACVALMYHPDDASKYEGKRALTPLFHIEVPMVADAKVDREKGTGLVMCCTFGDDTDKEWWDKHGLATRVILNKYGKLDSALLQAALDRPEGITPATLTLIDAIQNRKVSNADPKHPGAREVMLGLLKEQNLLTGQTPVTHAVKTAERSGAPLEILPTQQWFVRVLDKKTTLTARAEECAWHPEWMKLRMLQWIEGLNQDWCISRQRYFGVPFPVWYSTRPGEEGKVLYAKPAQLPVNPLVDLPEGYSQGEVVADQDVMDTWATSSISPQLSAHGISPESCQNKDRFAKLYPADLRPQAHEIIRTWAFYTLVKSELHTFSIPWKNLMISGWCLAEDKSKMSKSKGNVVTPTALIEEKGTDAVRYWAATSRLGQDTAFSPDLLKIGKKLVGKLWNATQFAALHLAKLETAPTTAKADLDASIINETLDRWILSRLAETVDAATAAFHNYEYAIALDATNQFFWADFCDNYLELIKKRVYNEDGSATMAQQQSAIRALYYVLEAILTLYAPFMPHVTEELYSHIFADNYTARGSLHARGSWVKQAEYGKDQQALALGPIATQLLEQVRKAKSDAKRSIKTPVARMQAFFPAEILRLSAQMNSIASDLKGAGSIESLEFLALPADGTVCAAEIVLAAEADAA